MTRAAPRVLDVVQALLEHGGSRRPRIAFLTSEQATLIEPSGRLIRILQLPEDSQSLGLLDLTLRNNPKAGTDVILVGGSVLDRSRIEAAFPKMQLHHFRVAHIADSGSVAIFPEKKAGELAAVLSQVEILSPRREEELLAHAERDERERQEESRSRALFFQRVQSKPATMTTLILAVIGVVFVAQIMWFPGGIADGLGFGARGADSTERWLIHTIQMGALYSPLVDEGQWWRILTAGFMHHGLMHFGVNCFALYILGRQLEKVLGASRFLVVYAAALVGGSVGSYYMTDGVSVGASGAIWGLLGAQLALAYRRPPVLPLSLAEAIRPMAMQNVFLNVMISLVPGIDWAAHLGGGVCGGLVLATGILYKRRDPDAVPFRVRPLAVLAAVLLTLGAGLCLLSGYVTRGLSGPV